MNSFEALEKVTDSETFLAFAQVLLKERKEVEGSAVDEVGFVGDWANNDISGFIEGALAWAKSSEFGVNQDPSISCNPWKQFASFLYCGKIYE